MNIVVYDSIVRIFYDTAISLFIHRGGKMKYGTVKSFWKYINSGGLFY